MPKASRAGSKDRQNGTGPQQQLPRRRSFSRKEMSPRARTIALSFGDILCFLIFVVIGTNQHSEGFNLGYTLWLAVPFVVAWFLVAPFVGAFRADIATQPKKMALRTALSWLATWPVAMLFRWLLVDRVKNPPTAFSSFFAFALVTLFFNMVILLIWRVPFVINNAERKREEANLR